MTEETKGGMMGTQEKTAEQSVSPTTSRSTSLPRVGDSLGTDEDDVVDDLPAEDDDLRDANTTAREAEEHDRLERRLGDHALIERLRAGGFYGREYEIFEYDLIRYATSVLNGWLRFGRIFALLADRSWPAKPTERELRELANDADVRSDLISMTLAQTLPRFKTAALSRSGWQVNKGASITTYFMGACIVEFANVFRTHRRRAAAWQAEVEFHKADLDENAHAGDIAAQVVGDASALELFNTFSPREQPIIALSLAGYEQDEIVELTDETSVRSIEGVLYRWRTAQRTKHQGKERKA